MDLLERFRARRGELAVDDDFVAGAVAAAAGAIAEDIQDGGAVADAARAEYGLEAEKAKGADEEMDGKKAKDVDDGEDDDKHKMTAENAAAVSKLCNDAGLGKMAEGMIKAGLSIDEATVLVDEGKRVLAIHAGLCAPFKAAVPRGHLETLLAQGGASHALSGMLELINSAQSSTEIVNRQNIDARPKDHGWGDAVAKVTGKR